MWKLQQHIIINIGWDRLCPLKTTQSNRKIIKNTAITKYMAGYPLIQDQRSKMNTRFSTKGGSQTLMPKILKLPPNFCPLLPPTKILRPHFIHAPPPVPPQMTDNMLEKSRGWKKNPGIHWLSGNNLMMQNDFYFRNVLLRQTYTFIITVFKKSQK